jgi:D-3-phosphoglycerate dehydrogenase
MRILVTPRSLTAAGLDHQPDLEPLRAAGFELVAGPAGRTPTEDELLQLVPGVTGWLAGVEQISARVLAAADSLRVLSRNGVGADAVDLQAAESHGIRVELARGANARGVAELAVLLTLAALRSLPQSHAALKAGRWERTLGREMPDVTLGVVGFGAVGRIVAGLASAMGATVLAYDPFTPVLPESGATAATLEELFTRSDVVSLHSPPPADGRPLVGASLLGLLPRGAALINTARSALVDDDAVLSALDSGALSAYAVDAFASEPPTITPLLAHERTILSPHLGGYTDASVRRATQQAVANLLDNLGR